MRWYEWLLTGAAVALLVGGAVLGLTGRADVVAGAMIASAPVIVFLYQGVQTRRAVEAGQREADASFKQITEVRTDRDLAVRPVLVTALTHIDSQRDTERLLAQHRPRAGARSPRAQAVQG